MEKLTENTKGSTGGSRQGRRSTLCPQMRSDPFYNNRYIKGFLLATGILLSTISNPLHALGSCSSYTGQAVLNEFYHNNQSLSPNSYFVEAKALNFALVENGDYQNWSVTLCSQQAVDDGVTECISGDSAFAAANANTTYEAGLSLANASWPSDKNNWILVDQADWTNDSGYIDLNDGGGHGMEALLLDGNGDLIDFLSVDSYSTHIGTTYTTCSLTQTSYEGGSNTFDIQRVPDGTGPWAKNPGNSGDQTAVDTNETLPPPPAGDTYPELTIDSFLVSQDADAVFTIRFNVEDPFSEDVTISYETFEQTATAGVGNDYTAVSGTITIPVGQTFASVSVDTLPTSTPDEYFYLVLTDITSDNATILNAVGMATITGKPTITSITTSCDNPNQISVLFGEPITTATAETVSNYALDNEAIISAALLQGDQQTVLLTTSTLSSIVYTLTVNNIDDTDSPTETIAANSQKTFKHNCGPVAYYRMDEEYWTGAADEIVDSSGNGLNGTAVGGVTTSFAKVCNGAMLDGITLAYGEVSDHALLDIEEELTVSIWIKPNIIPPDLGGAANSQIDTILSKDENYEFHVNSDGKIYWWWVDSGGSEHTLTSATSVTAGNWHHIAIVYSQSDASQKIYIDGILDSNQSGRSETLQTNSDPLQFGGDQYLATREFDGLLDEIRIYERAQAQGEIQADMNATHSCSQLACGFRDKFTNAAFDNNDGFLSFTSDWVETNDNNSASSGDAYIDNGELVLSNDSGGAQPVWTRELNLTGATSATLSFSFRTESGVDNRSTGGRRGQTRDSFKVLVSDDGGANWTTLETIDYISGSLYEAKNYDISSHISINTQIRLQISEDYSRSDEKVYFYQVSVNAPDLCSVVDHYEISLPIESIACANSTVTVTACTDSSSPCSNPTTSISGETATLATSAGSLGSSSISFNASGVATTTLSYTSATDGENVTVTLSDESASANNSRQCCLDGVSCNIANSCDTNFKTAGFIFSSATNGSEVTIPTHIASNESASYYLRAVKTNTDTKACEAALSAPTNVDFAFQCTDPTTCTTTNLPTCGSGYSYLCLTPYNGATAQTAQPIASNPLSGISSYSTIDLYFDANGNAPLTFNYLDAGMIQLHATKAAGGSLLTDLTGSSNPFVVKPYSLVLTDIKQTAAPQLANPDPAATDASGSVFIKAGEAFSATVTAVNASALCTASLGTYTLLADIPTSCITPNYGQESTAEGVTLTNTLVAGLGLTNNPALNNPAAFGGFSDGSATGTTFSWNEVGIINLTPDIGDGDYLGSGGVAATTLSPNVGRFVPASFVITLNNSPSFAEAISGTFTYLGQNFTYGTAPDVTIKAVATDGTTITQNYENGFWKLGANITPGYTDLAGATDNATIPQPIPLTTPGAAVGFGDTTDVNGQVTLTLHNLLNFSYTRPATNATVDPFDADVQLNLAVLDSDGVAGTLTPTAYSQHLGFSSDSQLGSGNSLAGTNEKTLRLGRALIIDGYARAGSPATMPLTLEFFNGTSFVNSAADATTAFTDTLLSCSDPIPPLLDDPLNPTIACADITITPAAPATVGNSNSFSLAPGNNNEGTLTYQLSLAGSTFLQFDWDGDGVPDNNPAASVTFGQYRDYHGDERFIFWREVER